MERAPETEIAPQKLSLLCSKSVNDLCKPSAATISRKSVSLVELQNYQGTKSENFPSWLRQSVPKSPKSNSLPCCSTTENSKEIPISMWNDFDEVHPAYTSESVTSGYSDGEHFLIIQDGYASFSVKSENEIKLTNTYSKPISLGRRVLGEHEAYTSPELGAAVGQSHMKGNKIILHVIEERERGINQREERERNSEEQEYTCSASLESKEGRTKIVLIGDKFYKLEQARAVIKGYMERKPETEIVPPKHRLICSRSVNDLFKTSAVTVSRRSVSLGDLQNYQGTNSENFCSTTENSKGRPTFMWNDFDEAHPVYSSESVTSGDSDREHFLIIKDGYASFTVNSDNEIKPTNTDSKSKSFCRRVLGAIRRVFWL